MIFSRALAPSCRHESRSQPPPTKKKIYAGGKHFSKNLRPLDADGNEIREKQGSDDDDDEDEDESDEEEEAGPAAAGSSTALTREERKKQKALTKEKARQRTQGKNVEVGDLPSEEESSSDDEDMPANPNHSKAARNQARAAPVAVDEAAEAVKNLKVSSSSTSSSSAAKAPAGPQSRRERESMEAALAKERYRKLHEAGKTDEAKADLARLRQIREKRESEAAQRQVRRRVWVVGRDVVPTWADGFWFEQAEKEERESQEKAKRAEIGESSAMPPSFNSLGAWLLTCLCHRGQGGQEAGGGPGA